MPPRPATAPATIGANTMRLFNLALCSLCLILTGVCLAAWTLGHIDTASGFFTTGTSLFCAALARTQPEID
jgi:hypothetical protein